MERASCNAPKHGLLAREAVIGGEDPEEFELYREGMLAERIVGLSWRLRRAERLHAAAFDSLQENESKPKWTWSDATNEWVLPKPDKSRTPPRR